MQQSRLPNPAPRLRRRPRHDAATLFAGSAVALTAAFAPTSSVGADVVQSFYVPGGPYGYSIYHMPDLDQRREALPNDGAMYCVPTAAINLFCYAANHGYPFIQPGPGNWQSNARYDDAEAAIDLMGDLMSTSGTGGTGGQGAYDGFVDWTQVFGGGLLDCKIKWRSSGYTPTLRKMTKLACQGWIVSFAYGRYDVAGSVGSIPIVARDGGHAVTLTRSYFNPGTNQRLLRYRDPADDSANLATQSSFKNKSMSFTNLAAVFDTSPLTIQTLTAIDYPSADGRIRFIDTFWATRPKFGLAFANIGDSQVGGAITLIDPIAGPAAGGASMDLTLPEIPLPPGQSLLDLHLDADGADALALLQGAVGGPSQLKLVDLLTGEFQATPFPEGMKRFCVSPLDELFAFDFGGKLYRLAGDGSVKNAISSNPTPSALFYNPVDDQLVLLSIPQRRVNRYTRELSLVSSYVVPTSVPMSGDGSVTVDPTSGRAWFCTDASDKLFGVLGNGPVYSLQEISLPAVQNPVALRGSADGHLFVAADGGLHELAQTGDAEGAWDVLPDSPFAGQPASKQFTMLTTGTNFDAAEHAGPGYYDIHPDDLLALGVDVPDCTGDLNGDDQVDGADIGVLLSNWGAAAPDDNGVFDFNGDGVVDGADFGVLLSQWGPCP